MKNLFLITAIVCASAVLPAPLPAQTRNRPEWTIKKPPDTAEMSYFTSKVDEFADKEEAVQSAVNNVNNAVANSTLVYIRSSVSERSRSTESREEFSINIETDSYTDIILSGIEIETYSEGYAGRNNQQRYRAWAIATISKAQAEENRRSYMETIEKRYVLDPVVRGNNLSGALSAYNGIYDALLQNPLHRTIAVYGDGQSLFEYCRLKISEIAGSLSFEDIPPQTVQRGGAPAVPVRVSSPLFADTGPLECTVTIQDGNRSVPGGTWTLGDGNSFLLRLPVSGLEAGNYTVTLELNALSSALTRNPKTSFRLEVRPASAEIRFQGETLTQAEERILSQAVQQALQTHHVPLLTGYEFLVTLTAQTRVEPVTGTTILICDVSVSLTGGGDVLFQSTAGRITEISRDRMLRLAAEYIRNNRDFWDGAARHIRR
jgi:hypothetical protein